MYSYVYIVCYKWGATCLKINSLSDVLTACCHYVCPQFTMSSAHPLVEGVAGACHSGDVGTLQAILTQHPELDINLSTEGGATLLMHAIIGAGGMSHTCTPTL